MEQTTYQTIQNVSHETINILIELDGTLLMCNDHKFLTIDSLSLILELDGH